MLIGQDRAGKTSLKKSLKRICFDPEEDSTVGIEADPSLFKVTTETWRTGTTENDQNAEEATSFDYHTAMWMVDNLQERRNSTQFETDTEENETTLDSEITETSESYLVPSMLKTHPSSKIISLVASAKNPSLFITFETAQVPPGFFHRLVLQFYQWGKEAFLRPIKPLLFQNFARFFTSGNETGSVIFACNASTIEVVIHTEDHHDTALFTCASVVRRQVGLMLQSMRNEFFWLRNMKCEMSVLCPVCCPDGTIDACLLHEKEGCKKEQCLHFWSLSELCRAKQTIICTKSASAQKVTVDVKQFLPWYSPEGDQVNIISLI